MTHMETDYLVIGSGAVGLAFADTLLDELPDVHITLVDRHGRPGGHWNDAYPFVALHQPSAFYGVNSLPLGANRKDAVGVNKGFYELASGPEVSGYFHQVMHQKLLPSGRVSYHPMCNYLGDHRFESILSGAQTGVTVRRKLVDATYYGTSVPATHQPKYAVADGVRLVTPNALAQLWQGRAPRPAHFVIVGAGKTAMDVGVWLLQCGAHPDAIQWVVPRDSWVINRAHVQPGIEFFHATMGGQANEMEAIAHATSVDDLFERLEACDQMLRIDPAHKPGMFHYATMSRGEVELLRQITQVVRLGHLRSIEPGEMVLDHGRIPVAPDTLFIDCTASAVEKKPIQPVFQADKVVLQMVRVAQPAFSAALVAFVEAHYAGRRPEKPPVRPRAVSRRPRRLPGVDAGQHDQPVPLVARQGAAQLDPPQPPRWLRKTHRRTRPGGRRKAGGHGALQGLRGGVHGEPAETGCAGAVVPVFE